MVTHTHIPDEVLLGSRTVYLRFVLELAKIAAPLIHILKKSQPNAFDLDEKKRTTVDGLKRKLISPPVLGLRRSSG